MDQRGQQVSDSRSQQEIQEVSHFADLMPSKPSWQEISAIFDEALERPSGERVAWIGQACHGDSALLQEVEKLLAAHEKAGGVLDRPLQSIASEALRASDRAASGSELVGPYRIVSEIGRGGMGIVYKAEDPRLGRFVALKFLPPHMMANERAKQRFLSEARAASALDHPNICTIHDIGQTEGGRLFFAMAYYDGQTLAQRIEQGPLPIDETLSIAEAVAAGLSHAHEAGVIHRDIKPSNVLLTTNGQVKILDFGLAKRDFGPVSDPDTRVGTVAYMSPEQASGREVDQRTDLWSLGVTIYEMIVGKPPFSGEYMEAIIYSILNEEPEPLKGLRTGVPVDIERIVRKAMTKRPEERYQQATDLAVDLRQMRRALQTGSTSISPVARAEPEIPSIAVLPFLNMNRDEEGEFFADGMTEDITSALTKVEGLRVAAYSSALPFKGKTPDLREVGSRLRVHHVLLGSVRRMGNRLRITVRLSSVEGGTDVWSERFDRVMEDVFDIQEQISQAVAETLRGRLVGASHQQLARRYTKDVDAYNLYLKGRYFWNKRTPEEIHKARSQFQEALSKDPDYAPALSGLADCQVALAFYGLQPPMQILPEAKDLALKALRIDPTLAETHTSVAFADIFSLHNWREAERELAEAIKINPEYATAHFWLGVFAQTGMGQLSEAVESARRAQEIDPVTPIINIGLGLTLFHARRYDEAIAELEKALELESDYHWGLLFLGRALVQKGDGERGLATLEQCNLTMFRDGHLGFALAVSGQRDRAEALLRSLLSSSKPEYVTAYQIALIYCGLGETDRAIEWLEKAYRNSSSQLVWFAVTPEFDAIRLDPRFAALLERMNFAGARVAQTTTTGAGVGPRPQAVTPHTPLPGPPPPADLATPPLEAQLHNFPRYLTSFIGRRAELRALKDLLKANRLLTLTGPGGAGKTRLSQAVAREAAGRFAHGAYFVGLTPVSDPDLVPSAIARVLAVPDSPGVPVLENLKNGLESKELLLVLDNFEQVLGAATVVQELLASCPALKVIATSRAPLRVGGEQEFVVPPLDLPGEARRISLESAEQHSAVKLFVERARAARPDFSLTESSAGDVAELCRRLDGLPLAIELAAARAKLFSPHLLLSRLGERLDFLSGGTHDLPDRHRTLREAISWSYDLLDEPAQQFFRRLSVFSGGWTIAAAEAISAGQPNLASSVLQLHSTLADQSLIRQIEKEGGEPRFWMLETIRDYGREQLREAGEEQQVAEVHAKYFLKLAERAAPELTGAEQGHWLDRLETENANLRAAFHWMEESGQLEFAVRMGVALWRFWIARGQIEEGLSRLEQLLDRPLEDVPPAIRIQALHGLGTLCHYWGQMSKARDVLKRCVELARDNNDKPGVAKALTNLAWVDAELSELGTARALSQEAFAMHKAMSDKRGMALALNNIGWTANYRGDYPAAKRYHERSLALRREIGDQRGIAFALTNLAWAESFHGELDQADQYLDEAMEILRPLNDRVLWGWAVLHRANVARERGKLERAARILEECLAMWPGGGHPTIRAWSRTCLGAILHQLGETQRGVALLSQALTNWGAVESPWGVALYLFEEAAVARDRGEAKALELFQRSLKARVEIGDQRGVAECLEELAFLLVNERRYERAAVLLGAAGKLRETLQAPVPPRRRQHVEAHIESLRSRLGAAKYEQACRIGESMRWEEAAALATAVDG